MRNLTLRDLPAAERTAALASLPATRKEALAANASQFFTGKPCTHGHLTARWTINGACEACARENTRRWRNGLTRAEGERVSVVVRTPAIEAQVRAYADSLNAQHDEAVKAAGVAEIRARYAALKGTEPVPDPALTSRPPQPGAYRGANGHWYSADGLDLGPEF